MRRLELPRHSTTNRQTDSGHTLHMKTVGFGKGMRVETEERGYTNKTYLQIFVIVAVSCSNHTIVPSHTPPTQACQFTVTPAATALPH
jgi:hypothetical protein